MRPENAASAERISSAVRDDGSATGSGLASASSVAVVKPRWTSATYVFSSFNANSARRVADSKRTGSTPVASGSSVPAWPTRCAPVTALRRLTTENDVSPAPLLTFSTPVLKRSVLRRGGKDGLLRGRQHE